MRLSEMIYTEEEMETFRKKYEKLITKQTEKIEFQTNRIDGLEEENRKLREEIRFLEECLDNKEKVNKSLREENKKLKEYNGELIENHKKDIAILCEENENLNIKVASLEGEIKGLNSVIDKLREELSAYDREFRDEDKKAKNIFMEEDTLQELRDLGKI